MLKPFFIFSLPRSGSTLLQRVLAGNKKISTVTEPWVLLPFVYPLKPAGVYAEYSHHLTHLALNDFIDALPDGKQDYLKAVRIAILELYRKVAEGEDAEYFLDKTPRYSLIANDIINMFPDGKFIYLWRNPLSIISSMIETWWHGRWNLFKVKVDLFDGMVNMVDSCRAHSDQVLTVQYEHFLTSPGIELQRIERYLNIELDPKLLEQFSQISFSGRMGDPTGAKKYDSVDNTPIEKWKSVINNPLRKLWCRRYLQWLGEERLGFMGYDLKESLWELENVKPSLDNLFQDAMRLCWGELSCALTFSMLKHKSQRFPKWKWMKDYS